MQSIAKCGFAVVLLALLPMFSAADPVPYPTPGVENTTTYTFTASGTGDVLAYFAGSTASFVNEIGMSVNGGLVPSFGLQSNTTLVGTVFDLGPATMGDTLVFVMHNLAPGIGNLYSDPAQNTAYDGGGTHNHIYSAPYNGTGLGGGIPAGTYVAFEDLPLGPPYGPPDWNYHDENFVFVGVLAAPGVAPLPSTAVCGLVLLPGVWFTRRALRNRVAAV